MNTLLEIVICIGLVVLEFLAVALLVAPRAVWRALCKGVAAMRERTKASAAEARERLERLLRPRGPGFGQGRLA